MRIKDEIAIYLMFFMVVFFVVPGKAWAEPVEGNLILYNAAGMDGLHVKASTDEKAKALVGGIARQGDSQLKVPVDTVISKTILPSGASKHDYVSLARYYWPDPGKENGCPYINKDGLTNPEREDVTRYDAVKLDKMISAVDSLGVAYYVTRQTQYADRAVLWLRTWFINPDTCMNPNLDYAQGIPGKTNGSPSGIIEAGQFVRLIDAAIMLDNYQGWTVNDKREFKNWLREYLNWLRTSTLGIKEKNARNNHGVWYDAQVAAIAYYLGDTELMSDILNNSVPKRVQAQIRPDGTMPLEMVRTRSLHYVIFNLEAFIVLARLGDKIGIDVWTYEADDGQGIKNAVDYLVPYLLEEEKWQHQMIGAEKEYGSARYFALAQQHFRNGSYAAVALKILGSATGKEEVAVRTLLYE